MTPNTNEDVSALVIIFGILEADGNPQDNLCTWGQGRRSGGHGFKA